jgi:hypothetical protein
MTNFKKLLNILLLVLMGISLVLLGLFYFGGEVKDAALPTPNFTNSFLNWGIILIFVSSFVTFGAELANIFLQPKKAIRTLISIGILVVIVLISYILADDTPLDFGYKNVDNVSETLIFSDVFIFTAYITFGISIAALLYTEISRLLRK